MSKAYKRPNGQIAFRNSDGSFKKTTFQEALNWIGVDAKPNNKLLTYICNECGREFTPIMEDGKCCGVNNKRLKEKSNEQF